MTGLWSSGRKTQRGGLKNHAFLRNVWTGSFETLASMVKVTGHVTAYELRQFQRFASFGPWPH
eukprot:3256396-Prymnesium_polylepis.1